jgi:hypothetical protein
MAQHLMFGIVPQNIASFTDADGKNPIIFRVVYRHQVRDIFTGLYCSKNSWVAPLRKVSPNDPESGAINSNMELVAP